MKRGVLLLVLGLLPLVSGCSHVLSREALRSVDRDLSYATVKANPSGYAGHTLLLGGVIVKTDANRDGSSLEILRYSVDRWGEPRRVDEAGGRFIARTDRFLDPELYRLGRFVTLTGSVVGTEQGEVNGVPYTFPLFTIGEIYPWQQPLPLYDPPVHGSLYLYYPYGPYYDPWWPTRPYWYTPYYDRYEYRDWDDYHNGGWHGPGSHEHRHDER